MLAGQVPGLLSAAGPRLEHAAEQGDAAVRGLERPVLLRRDMDPDLQLLEVGDVEAVGAEHGQDHGQEGEAVEEAEYDAEERHLQKERSSSGHWREILTSKSGGTWAWDERAYRSYTP